MGLRETKTLLRAGVFLSRAEENRTERRGREERYSSRVGMSGADSKPRVLKSERSERVRLPLGATDQNANKHFEEVLVRVLIRRVIIAFARTFFERN